MNGHRDNQRAELPPRLRSAVSAGMGTDRPSPSPPTLFDALVPVVALLQHAGFIDRLPRPLVNRAKTDGEQIATTGSSAIALNVIAGDQYVAGVLSSRAFREEPVSAITLLLIVLLSVALDFGWKRSAGSGIAKTAT